MFQRPCVQVALTDSGCAIQMKQSEIGRKFPQVDSFDPIRGQIQFGQFGQHAQLKRHRGQAVALETEVIQENGMPAIYTKAE